MKRLLQSFALLITAAAIFSSTCYGNDAATAEEIRLLRQQLNQIEQRLKQLESTQAPGMALPASSPTSSASKAGASLTVGANGITATSANSNFIARIRGFLQADGRFYPSDTSHDTFLMRRVCPIFEGTVWKNYDYRVMLDFGQGFVSGSSAANQAALEDAYANARPLPEFQIQAGKFKEPVGLERLQSVTSLTFVERAYPTQLVPNRDVGVMLHGELFKQSLNYAAGIFNGVPDGGTGDFETTDGDKDFAGRLFAHPFKRTDIKPLQKLGIGIAGTAGNQKGIPRGFSSPGQARFFSYLSGAGTNSATANVTADGLHWRLAPQTYYYYGSFGFMGEYTISDMRVRRSDGGPATFDTLRNQAWQATASFVLTGEDNSYKGVVPRHALAFDGQGWGALEVATRISQLSIDPQTFPTFASSSTSAHRATSWAFGFNWYLNRNVKVSVDYEQTDFAGGQETLVNKEGEKVIFTRVQLAF